ncbi:ATP-binding protein [Nitrincola sp. MINF-07-Sa-05]|uniref:ATP-binding protein n=1 Tax=Nitrincola salilacus TaxID=3400273 RepID=UPI00391831F6
MRLKFTPGSLRSVLLLQVALPLLLMLAVILAATLSVVGHFAEERLQRDLSLVARAIRLPVTEALQRDDIAQLQNSLASIFDITEVYGAYLFDADGQRLISFGAVSPTRRQADEAMKMTVDGEFAQYESIRGRDVYSFFLPLFDRLGQPSGLLQVTRLRRDIEAELKQLKRRSWGGFALASLLILGALSLTHQRAIGQPLQRLLDSIRKVESGERQHRATEDGPREVIRLASELNQMLDAIQHAENKAREQQKEQERLSGQLREAETLAALGQLSAGVAHELGAPLSVVDGRARRLLRRHTQAQDVSELEDIRHQAQRMTAIVEQLLSYGRSVRAQPHSLDVAALIARARKQLQDEGLQIQLKEGPTCRIRGDALMLEQALINLMRNACQACPDGPVTLGWQCEDGVVLYVEDAGPGIPPEQIEHLFRPFYTTKAPGEGSGLGLAIVKRIMREHHGHVEIHNSHLGGARFELHFTIREESADENQPASGASA